MKVTSIDQLKAIKQTDIVELPGFTDDTTFIAELKKPNMMQLIATGKIPNTLLTTAMGMFNGKTHELTEKATQSAKDLADMANMMVILARACLVSPTYNEILEADKELTEQQLIRILTYTQGGVKALERFRTKPGHTESN